MQIVIIGSGNLAVELAEKLLEMDEEVVIVDRNLDLIREETDLDCSMVEGIPIDIGVLRQARVETAQVVLVVTPNDNLNLMAGQICATTFQVPRVLILQDNLEKKKAFERYGFETVCSTELIVAKLLGQLGESNTSYAHAFLDKELAYTRVSVEKDMYDSFLSEIEPVSGQLIVGLVRDGKFILADEDLKLEKDDEIVLLSAV